MTRTRNMPRYDTTVSFHCHFLFLVKISLLKYWPKFRIPNSGQKLAFSIEIYDFLPKFRNFCAKITFFIEIAIFYRTVLCFGRNWSKMTEKGHFWFEIALFDGIILYFRSKMEISSHFRIEISYQHLKMVYFWSKMGVENTC